jgi:polyisoprenoid-binding protein YceI
MLWQIDPTQSLVKFSVKHLVVSTVTGEFKKVTGTVKYDGAHLENASVHAVIETGSLDTQVKARDKHLESPEVFDPARFPCITFDSRKIESAADGSFEIAGTLSLHGISKNLVLKAKPLHLVGKPTDGAVRLATSATTELNRKDFGITIDKAIDHGGAVVGENIKVTLAVVLAAPTTGKSQDKNRSSEGSAQ